MGYMVLGLNQVIGGPAQLVFTKLSLVVVAQLVRASVCGTEGRGFESRHPPIRRASLAHGFQPERREAGRMP